MRRVLGDGWIKPAVDDWNRPFFTAGVLSLQQCAECQHIQHPPEEVCERCRSFAFQTFESVGAGRVESVAVVTHAIHPGLADAVPYAVVLVSVDDAPDLLITGNITNRGADDVQIGDRVRVVFEVVEDVEAEHTLRIPQWEVV